ncbi:MAG: hypothetical protein AVDCRST_MAG69-1135 [uncultured Solirubrobacteraceae bacterium]|uniref:Uncharacterized protein n=1 Tax=uncultured Solirubrobacteraceae bacterium TaxID=1162706 RepID=A0A6J4S1H0_9ACTN|nr:MAG: hypothetical protein AVDCRST_MAG69-1135 [uncultured Solirubrobacteraceae bacterium]
MSEPATSAQKSWDAFFSESSLRAAAGFTESRCLGDFDRATFSASTRLVVLALR